MITLANLDQSIENMIFHEYRDWFPVTKNEYRELIRPYFKTGLTIDQVIDRLWQAQLVDPIFGDFGKPHRKAVLNPDFFYC